VTDTVTAFDQPTTRTRLDEIATALTARGLDATVVTSGSEARAHVDRLIPDDALVYNTRSQTLEDIGVAADVVAATRYRATRTHTDTLNPMTQINELRRHVSTMDVVIGSVHAVTHDGQVVIASASGSQLAPYAFGADRVIWVVGAQKIVPDLDTAFERIAQHCYPLENARLQAEYGMSSIVGKQLVISSELPGRISVILVEESLGF
jgi:hypothetical protein